MGGTAQIAANLPSLSGPGLERVKLITLPRKGVETIACYTKAPLSLVVLSHSCPPRRATRSVVLSHKISTPPACWPGESKFSSGQLSTQSSVKNTVESRNARCWYASCSQGKKSDKVQFRFDCLQHGSRLPKKSLGTMKKNRYLGNENYRGLYWRDPTVNSCPKEKPPGSPRTFSTVLYPRTSSLRAKQDRPCPFPFPIPPPSLLCSNRV